MTFQELLQIKEENKKALQVIQDALVQREKERAAVFSRPDDPENEFYALCARMKRKKNATPDELTRYNNLDTACTMLKVEIEKQKIVNAFIDEYISNAKKALAYNYYINELAKRPKTHNKPLHYKIVQKALQDIRDSMPVELTTNFYNIDFIYNGRYYSHLNNIDPDKLQPLTLELSDPAEIAKDNYSKYCQIFSILETAYKKINQLENTIATPFNDCYSMQAERAGHIAYLIKSKAAAALPWPLYRVFDK